MHPAFSVIFFTAVSGAGYGLLFLLGLALASGWNIDRDEALIVIATGVVFAAAGLASSMLHLGQPLRAWRAFSQWRSSWLSREGVASLFCFAPAIAIGACLFCGIGAGTLRILGVLLAALCAITVLCTARIYTSLKMIFAWHNGYVLPGYLLLGLHSGIGWFWALHAATHTQQDIFTTRIFPVAIVVSAIACVILKRAYWRYVDNARPLSTAESATGLGRFGAVASVESPHTEENYLTQEMGFVLARKHSKRLRSICLALIGVVPVIAGALAFLAGESPMLGTAIAVAMVVFITAGIFVERWLFFAEAKHVVMLYYGKTAHQSG